LFTAGDVMSGHFVETHPAFCTRCSIAPWLSMNSTLHGISPSVEVLLVSVCSLIVGMEMINTYLHQFFGEDT